MVSININRRREQPRMARTLRDELEGVHPDYLTEKLNKWKPNFMQLDKLDQIYIGLLYINVRRWLNLNVFHLSEIRVFKTIYNMNMNEELENLIKSLNESQRKTFGFLLKRADSEIFTWNDDSHIVAMREFISELIRFYNCLVK